MIVKVSSELLLEKPFHSKTMSLVKSIKIDDLIQSSSESKYKLEWIPCSEITDVKPTRIDNIHYAMHKYELYVGKVKETTIMLSLLGNNEECTPTLVSEFARIYSLPTHKYNNDDSQFRRYKKWLESRNELIKGFTKSNDDNYYMVAMDLKQLICRSNVMIYSGVSYLCRIWG